MKYPIKCVICEKLLAENEAQYDSLPVEPIGLYGGGFICGDGDCEKKYNE